MKQMLAEYLPSGNEMKSIESWESEPIWFNGLEVSNDDRITKHITSNLRQEGQLIFLIQFFFILVLNDSNWGLTVYLTLIEIYSCFSK